MTRLPGGANRARRFQPPGAALHEVVTTLERNETVLTYFNTTVVLVYLAR